MPETCVGCSLKEGFIVGGILLGYLASALWVGDQGGWRYMYGAALPPALIVFAGMVSPSFRPSSSSAFLFLFALLLPLLHLFFLFCTSSFSHLFFPARFFLSLFFFLFRTPSFSHFSSSFPAPLLPLFHLFFLSLFFFLFCTSSSSSPNVIIVCSLSASLMHQVRDPQQGTAGIASPYGNVYQL